MDQDRDCDKRMNRDRLRENCDQVTSAIRDAARNAGRDPSSVRLVAVTKRNPAEWVRALVALGATDLGENYPQELWDKAETLADLSGIRWHLIGHLQGNKLKRTLPMIGMVHAVDSVKLLQAIDDWAAAYPGQLPKVCLQINTSAEDSKHGWTSAGIMNPETLDVLGRIQNVQIVGLMTIAGYGTSDDEARPMFAQLRQCRDDLRSRTGLELPELSMGMSGDFATAIAEGSTLVRVGSALFEGVGDG